MSKMPDQMDEKQKERITNWLCCMDNVSRYSSSAYTASHAHRRHSSWTSVTASEESDFRTAHVGQAPRTEYRTMQEQPDIDFRFSSKSGQSRDSDSDFIPAKTQYTSISAFPQAPTSTSIRSERNKALSKLAGNAITTSRSDNRPTLRESSDSRQTAVNHACSAQPAKQTTNHIVNVHIQDRKDESIETMSPTPRVSRASKRTNASTQLSEEVQESLPPYRSPLLPTHEKLYTSNSRTQSSEIGKSTTRPGPVAVTRNSAGKLQLERCKNGSDHTDKSKKSHRRDLAK